MTLEEEYKEQLIIINNTLIKEIDRLNRIKGSERLRDFVIKDISNLKWCKSNLELSIYWMSHAHERNVYKGIENLKACKVY